MHTYVRTYVKTHNCSIERIVHFDYTFNIYDYNMKEKKTLLTNTLLRLDFGYYI